MVLKLDSGSSAEVQGWFQGVKFSGVASQKIPPGCGQTREQRARAPGRTARELSLPAAVVVEQ